MFMFYASPICRCSALSVAVCVTICVSVLCVVCASVSVCVYLWYICSASLLVKPANGKVAAASLSLGRDPGFPGCTGLESSSWAGENPGLGMLEEAAAFNIP